MNLKGFLLVIGLCCKILSVNAPVKPSATYVSKSVQVDPYYPYKHHFEPEKPIKCDWVKFDFFKTYIIMTDKGKKLKLKIVKITPYRDDIRYGLEDDNHLNYSIAVWIFDEEKKSSSARIELDEYSKDNTPVSLKFFQCKKILQ